MNKDADRKCDAVAAIVHYGPVEPTISMVRSTAEWAAKVIVVSNDGTAVPRPIKQLCTWIVPDRNLGYGGAINCVFEHSGVSPIVVLNTDVVIPLRTVERCLSVLDCEGIGIVGPLLINDDGTTHPCIGRVTSSLKRIMNEMPSESQSKIVECEWIIGAVMFIDASAYQSIGFDELFFLGYEDADYCLRVRQAGMRVVVATDSPATHVGKTTISPARWYYFATRNSIWFSGKHAGRAAATLLWLRNALLLPRVAAADILKRRGCDRTRMMALGIWHALSKSHAQFLPS